MKMTQEVRKYTCSHVIRFFISLWQNCLQKYKQEKAEQKETGEKKEENSDKTLP